MWTLADVLGKQFISQKLFCLRPTIRSRSKWFCSQAEADWYKLWACAGINGYVYNFEVDESFVSQVLQKSPSFWKIVVKWLCCYENGQQSREEQTFSFLWQLFLFTWASSLFETGQRNLCCFYPGWKALPKLSFTI